MTTTEYRTHIPSAYLEPEDVKAIINAVPEVSRHPERDKLLLELLWQTGGRVSEVLSLIPKRIGDASVILDNLKQKPSSPPFKECYIRADLSERLKAYCKTTKDDDYVFRPNWKRQGHLSPWYAWWIIKKAARHADIKRVNTRVGDFSWAWPHLFRHACAMHILDQTGSTEIAQRQLGHARISTTQGYAVLKLEKSRKGLSDMDW